MLKLLINALCSYELYSNREKYKIYNIKILQNCRGLRYFGKVLRGGCHILRSLFKGGCLKLVETLRSRFFGLPFPLHFAHFKAE